MGTNRKSEAFVRTQVLPPELQAAMGEFLRSKGVMGAETNGVPLVPSVLVWVCPGHEAAAQELAGKLQEGVGVLDAVAGLRLDWGTGPVLARLDRMEERLEAVARGDYQLRQENEELRKFQRLGFFEFALRVGGEDFRHFAVIMALGSRNAAATLLQIPQRSFYDRVERWAGMGPDYQRMLRFVDWRKRSGRRIKVRLGETAQSGEAVEGGENLGTLKAVAQQMADNAVDSRSYPDILREILGALQRQNPGNWQQVRDELVELVQEEVPQKSPQMA